MIEKLTMPSSTTGENPITFPIPQHQDWGTVTVLCGPNGCGKSYILRTLKDLLEGKKASLFALSQGWKIENFEMKSPQSHRARHHKSQMGGIGILSMKAAERKLTRDDEEFRARIALFGIILSSVKSGESLDHKRWMSSPQYRVEILQTFAHDDENIVTWVCRDDHEVVKLFEEVFSCRLGFRHAKGALDLVIGLPNRIAVAYANWSDGQRSFLTILATVYTIKPEVYIFDELENFMHPALISKSIAFLKRHVRQSIFSSHHPHLIFGKSVDQVYYIEPLIVRRPEYPEKVLKYNKQPAIARRVTRLSSDRAKLASAYRLFDVRDAALLSRVSASEAGEQQLHDALSCLFECSPAAGSASPYMDRQSEAIAEFVGSFNPSPRTILDWGAGLARSMSELSKRTGHKANASYNWILYEPDPGVSSRLATLKFPDWPSIEIIANRNELASSAAGIVLLTNVLHVLDPAQWADAIEDAHRALSASQRGIILVTEIYPLLAPERFAIPIPSNPLEEMFDSLGFQTSVRAFSINGSESYCLVASRDRPIDLDRLRIEAAVHETWLAIKTKLLRDYRGGPPSSTLSGHDTLLNAAFGLARIAQCLD